MSPIIEKKVTHTIKGSFILDWMEKQNVSPEIYDKAYEEIFSLIEKSTQNNFQSRESFPFTYISTLED